MVTMPRPAACFDMLPAEIRVKIYRQTLALDEEDQRTYRINGPQTLVSIVQVSSKVRREAMPVLFGRKPVPFSIHITESTVTFRGKRLEYARLHKFTPPVDLSNITDWVVTIDDEWRCNLRRTGVVRFQDPPSRVLLSLEWVFRRLRNVSNTPPTLFLRFETPSSCDCPGCRHVTMVLSNHGYYSFRPAQVPRTASELHSSEWFDQIIVLHFHCPQRADLREFFDRGTPIGHLIKTCIRSVQEDASFQEGMMKMLNRFTAPCLDRSHELKHLVDAASNTVDYGGLKFDNAFDDAMQCLHDLLQGPGKLSRGNTSRHCYPHDLDTDQIRDLVSKRRETLEDRKSYARFRSEIPWDWLVAALVDHASTDWYDNGLAEFLQFVEDSFIVLTQGLPVPWAAFFRHHLKGFEKMIPLCDRGDDDGKDDQDNDGIGRRDIDGLGPA